MGKRKKGVFGVWREFLIVLGVVIFIFAVVVLRVSQNALGDEPNNGHDNFGQNQPRAGKKYPFRPTVQLTASPAIQPSIQPIVTTFQTAPVPEVTPIITQAPARSEPVLQQSNIQTVPLSGMTVISGPAVSSPAVSGSSGGGGGSIVQTIRESIGSFGRGTVRQPTATPEPTHKPTAGTKEPEVALNKIQLNYKIKGDQVLLAAEDQKGKHITVDEADLRRVEGSVLSKLEKNGVVLSLASNNSLAISKDGITAITDLPISVDVESRSLIVTTVDGPKTVTQLPDKALNNILDLGIVSSVSNKEVPKIEYLEGEVIYKFDATRVYKILGLIDVTVPITILVSSDTGDMISGNQPLITSFVRLISI